MKYWSILGKQVIATAFNRNYENMERKYTNQEFGIKFFGIEKNMSVKNH